MTQAQKSVLRYMAANQIGAMFFEGRYRWPEDVRRDRALAERIYGVIGFGRATS